MSNETSKRDRFRNHNEGASEVTDDYKTSLWDDAYEASCYIAGSRTAIDEIEHRCDLLQDVSRAARDGRISSDDALIALEVIAKVISLDSRNILRSIRCAEILNGNLVQSDELSSMPAGDGNPWAVGRDQ